MFAKKNNTLCDLTWTFLWYGSMLDELWPFAEFLCMYRKKSRAWLRTTRAKKHPQGLLCEKRLESLVTLKPFFETEVAMVCCDPISNFVRQIIQVPTWPRTCFFFFRVFVKDWISNADRWWQLLNCLKEIFVLCFVYLLSAKTLWFFLEGGPWGQLVLFGDIFCIHIH